MLSTSLGLEWPSDIFLAMFRKAFPEKLKNRERPKDWRLKPNTKRTTENANWTSTFIMFQFFPVDTVQSVSSHACCHSSLSWWTVFLQLCTQMKPSFFKLFLLFYFPLPTETGKVANKEGNNFNFFYLSEAEKAYYTKTIF